MATWLYKPVRTIFAITYIYCVYVCVWYCSIFMVLCVCVGSWLYRTAFTTGSTTIQRIMVSSTVTPPLLNTSKSSPVDQILSDNSYHSNFIHTDAPAQPCGGIMSQESHVQGLGLFCCSLFIRQTCFHVSVFKTSAMKTLRMIPYQQHVSYEGLLVSFKSTY